MENASKILESLDAAEIHQRIEALDKERQALVILHRAAIRLERQKPAASSPSAGRAAQ
jgi:hypothetical protein